MNIRDSDLWKFFVGVSLAGLVFFVIIGLSSPAFPQQRPLPEYETQPDTWAVFLGSANDTKHIDLSDTRVYTAAVTPDGGMIHITTRDSQVTNDHFPVYNQNTITFSNVAMDKILIRSDESNSGSLTAYVLILGHKSDRINP